jgi:hypothetical protein
MELGGAINKEGLTTIDPRWITISIPDGLLGYLYEFTVGETHAAPGSYWWHTHDGMDPSGQDFVT